MCMIHFSIVCSRNPKLSCWCHINFKLHFSRNFYWILSFPITSGLDSSRLLKSQATKWKENQTNVPGNNHEYCVHSQKYRNSDIFACDGNCIDSVLCSSFSPVCLLWHKIFRWIMKYLTLLASFWISYVLYKLVSRKVECLELFGSVQLLILLLAFPLSVSQVLQSVNLVLDSATAFLLPLGRPKSRLA